MTNEITLPRVALPVEEQDDFTGEIVTEDRTKADYYVPQICRSWTKSTEGVLETASICAMAQKALPADELDALRSRLPFDSSTFSKLAKVGRDDRFRSPEVKRLLPSKFSVAYELSKLSDGNFQKLIDEGKLTPELKRADLKTLLPPRPSSGGKRRQAASGSTEGAEGGRTVLPPMPVEELSSMPSEALADWIRPIFQILAERGDRDLLGEDDHPPATDHPVDDGDDEGDVMQKAAPVRREGPSDPEAKRHALREEGGPDERVVATPIEPPPDKRDPSDDGVEMLVNPTGQRSSERETSPDLRCSLERYMSLAIAFAPGSDQVRATHSRIGQLVSKDGLSFTSDGAKDDVTRLDPLLRYHRILWRGNSREPEWSKLAMEKDFECLARRIAEAPVRQGPPP